MSAERARRPRTSIDGGGMKVVDRSVERAASGRADPLVLALAQLVRDRWAVERADGRANLAFRARPSNMPSMDVEPGSDARPSA